MVFSSLLFIYFYLPICLASYFLVKDKYKNLILASLSLVFIFLGDPKYFYVLLIVSGLSYSYGVFYSKSKNKGHKKIAMIFSIIAIFSTLVFFKYYDFLITSLNNFISTDLNLLHLGLPLGISFYIFQASSYILDIYKNKIEAELSLINYMAYLTFFPQLIAGPIVQYVEVREALYKKDIRITDVSNGIYRFILGLGKKVILANQLGVIVNSIPLDDRLGLWVRSIAFSLQLYFDFSGYSDMAIGLGKIFGFNFPENFIYPYSSKSVTEFWRRWHISLGRWFREYVYIPLGGNKTSLFRWVINIFVVWFLTGLWHGASWNFVLWGIIMASLLLFEKLFANILNKIPNFFRVVFTFLTINFSMVVFDRLDIGEAISIIKKMLGLGSVNLTSSLSKFILMDNIVLIMISLILAFPTYPFIKNKFFKEFKYEASLKIFISLFLLVISTAYLINDSFNPFLYFRF